ncbi:MAG: tRNA lysidine(34) synthetase TilS [Hyphomicrobiaceae bacterium]
MAQVRVDDWWSGPALEACFAECRDFDNVLLAVSGGADSAALLHLFAIWARQDPQFDGHVYVLTIDHRLRPEARKEADGVAGWAQDLGYPHQTLTWPEDKPLQGLQDAARAARYKLLCTFANGLVGKTVMLTAHTRDDQAETVLMRLARGSGPDGLAAIPRQMWRDGACVLRPLLNVSRAQLVQFLEAHQLQWFEDPSNALTQFERVAIREARAARSQLNLTNVALARTAKRMARARASLQAATRRGLADVIARQTWLDCGVVVWSRADFSTLDAEIAVRSLRQLVFGCGGQPQLPNLGQIEDLYEQLGQPDFAGSTLHGCRILVEKEDRATRFTLLREGGRRRLENVRLPVNEWAIWDRRFKVRVAGAGVAEWIVGPCDQCAVEQAGGFSELGWPEGLHRDALQGLPAIWRKNELVAIPALGWRAGIKHVEVRFLSHRILDIPSENGASEY